MKRFLVALLLMLICSSAFAEYVTILPISNAQIENIPAELLTLSDIYGRTTTIRYWVSDAKSPFALALNNTNIYPVNSLTTTEDLLCENKLNGLYVGAETQVAYPRLSAPALKTVSFSNANQDYQANVRSNVALTSVISEQANSAYSASNDSATGISLDSAGTSLLATNNSTKDSTQTKAITSDSDYQPEVNANVTLASVIAEKNSVTPSVATTSSELVSLNPADTAIDIEAELVATNKSTIMDTLLSGITHSIDYELPVSKESILIESSGGGGGSDSGGSGSGGSGGGAGASVPEPTTWAMLMMGLFTFLFWRNKSSKNASK